MSEEDVVTGKEDVSTEVVDIFQAAAEAMETESPVEEQADSGEKPGDTNKEEKKEEPEKKEELAKKEPAKDTPDWRWQKLKSREAKAKQAFEEVKSIKAEYDKRETAIKELLDDLVNDPVAGFKALAERAGADHQKVYEKLVRGKFMESNQTPESQELTELKKTVKELQTRLEEKKEPVVDEEKILETCVERVQEAYDTEEFAEKLPYLSDLEPHELEGRVGSGVQWCRKNAPHVTLPQLVERLEAIEKEEFEKKLEKRQNRTGNGPGRTVSKKEPSGLSGRDSAVPPTIKTYEDKEDRLAAAGDLLFR